MNNQQPSIATLPGARTWSSSIETSREISTKLWPRSRTWLHLPERGRVFYSTSHSVSVSFQIQTFLHKQGRDNVFGAAEHSGRL